MKVILFLYLYYTMEFPFVKGFLKNFLWKFFHIISALRHAPKCGR